MYVYTVQIILEFSVYNIHNFLQTKKKLSTKLNILQFEL